MATKKSVEGTATNNNVNTNSININIERPKRKTPRPGTKKSRQDSKSDNWFLKAVVGGIITVAVTMTIYVLQGNGKSNSNKSPEGLPRTNQIEGTKQH